MTIPFTKAHGAGNDFLADLERRCPVGRSARNGSRHMRSPHRHGRRWLDLLRDASIRLFNADGSEAEMSGNGRAVPPRC